MSRTAGIVVVLLCLTGCGEEGPQPGDLPYIPELANSEPVASDASYEKCGLGGGSQTVTGTIANSAATAKDFVITINWTDDALELRGQGVAVVEDLAPGASADWSVTGQLLDGATQCVPSFFRGDLD